MVNPLLGDENSKEKDSRKKQSSETLIKKISDPPAPPKPPAPSQTSAGGDDGQGGDLGVVAPKDSVLVSEEEVEVQEKNNQDHIARQIESLTGEIQALESRIERLTGGIASPSSSGQNPLPPIAATPSSQLPQGSSLPATAGSENAAVTQTQESSGQAPSNKADQQSIKPTAPIPAPPVPPSVAKSPTVPVAPAPAASSQGTSSVSQPAVQPPAAMAPTAPKPKSAITDIYSKLEREQKQKLEEIEHPKPDLSGGSDIAGTSGEVLIVIGVILMAFLLGSPLFVSGLGQDLKDLIKIVGWPASSGCLMIGFILSMFKLGKWAIKIFSLAALLIGLVLTLAVFGKPEFLGPLNPLIMPVLEFYQ